MTTVRPRSTTAVLKPHTNPDLEGPGFTASVIIVVFNGRRYVETCLESVLADIGGMTEVIVVDNASMDGSASIIRNQFPGVRFIPNTSNLGFAAACNQGAELAAGRYLLFLNQDTQVQPGWLAGLVQSLEEHPSAGMATSKLLFMQHPELINACGLEVHFTGLTFLRGLGERAEAYAKPGNVFAVSGASFAVRRELWEELGGFDSELGMYYEDTDLSWRAQLAGYAAVYNPDSVICHDQAQVPSASALYYSFRNRAVVFLSNWSAVAMVLLTPGLVLTELVEWAYALLLGRTALRSKLQAWGWLLTHFPAMYQRRKRVQQTRRTPDATILAGCNWRLTPKLAVSGFPGRLAAGVCSGMFYVNYRVALVLCRVLRI
jgi:GT2 family glycosyltransferase